MKKRGGGDIGQCPAHTWPVTGTGLDFQNEQTDYVMGQKLKTGKSRSQGACVILVLVNAFFQLFSIGHFLITMTNVWYEQLRDSLFGLMV